MKKKSQKRRSTAASPKPHSRQERPISDAYPALDNDLARDNLENDIPYPDLPD